MGRKQKKYHYIYKTTNIITGKYYIGMHSTDNLEDGYLGSGKRLWYSVKKYGKENHKVEILEFLPNRRSLIEREMGLVNEDIIKEELCMNLKTGGLGGFISDEQQKKRAIAAGKASAKKRKVDDMLYLKFKEIASKTMKKNHKEGKIKYDTFAGKKHTDETKRKISKTNSIKQKGENNSQFGSVWITNGKENKKIKKIDVIPNNWKLGRVFKNNE